MNNNKLVFFDQYEIYYDDLIDTYRINDLKLHACTDLLMLPDVIRICFGVGYGNYKIDIIKDILLCMRSGKIKNNMFRYITKEYFNEKT